MSRSPYPHSLSFLTLALGVLAASALGACQAYRPELRTTPERAVTAQAPPAGPLAFDQALRLLVERNPELAALRARAGGVNLRPNDATLDAELEVEDGNASQLTVGTDVLALFGLGARPAQQALARAVRSEALALHHERARELAAELATAYAEDRELQGLVTEVEALDAERFARAGLTTDADRAESASTREGWAAEREVVALERRQRRLTIGRLIGAGPEQGGLPQASSAAWPVAPTVVDRALFFARADLQRLAAAVEVSDRELRLAVARQIPTIGLSLGATFDPTEPLQILDVSLPLGAPAEACAAAQRRRAAVLDLEAGVLAARHDAAQARLGLEASEAHLRYWQAWWQAKRALVQAARARTDVDARELTMALHLEGEELEATRELREARLARAQARVTAAVAAGWPGPLTQASTTVASATTSPPAIVRGAAQGSEERPVRGLWGSR